MQDSDATNKVLQITSKDNKLQSKLKLAAIHVKISETILDVSQCIILAAMYKEYTCLWDETDVSYRLKNRRDEAFKSVYEDFNKETKLNLAEYEFKREVIRLRKICTHEKRQKIACIQKELDHKPSCTYYDYIKYLEVDVPPFECSICREQYPALGKLKVHVASHDGSLPFKCYICGHGFQMGTNLTVHMRRHVQDYGYSCKVCNKTCATSTEIKSHMRTHTGENPFVCYMCGVRTTTSSSLAEHIRTHDKDRSFKCEVCSKAFCSEGGLRDHKRNHSNVRNHICDICDKGFKIRRHLKQHKLLHSNEKSYVCKVCRKCFAQPGGLSGHMKSHGIISTTNEADINQKLNIP